MSSNEQTRYSRRVILEGSGGLGLGAVLFGCDPPTTPLTPGDNLEPTDPPLDTGTVPAETCAETPADVEGPFYTPGVPVRTELDLYGDPGPRLTLTGRVLDAACAPIAGAVVEIWHVAPSGAYDNTSPEMRYRGQTASAADGSWSFHTLMPVYYGGRPLHVHLKAWHGGIEQLTTQIYFEDDPQASHQDAALRVPRTAVGEDFECTFDVVIATA